MTPSEVDVLVIGAGPAGLMCANALVHAGVNVRVIDKRPSKVLAGQADGIQPRTIEVLQSYGLADRLLKEGNHMIMAAFYNPSPTGGIERTSLLPDVTAPSARYPFEVTLHQGAIEDIFLDAMREKGLEVSRPVVPTKIRMSQDVGQLRDPNAYAITVNLRHLGEDGEEGDEEVVRAKFVIGADGAHSWVRKEMGITMEGEQTDFIWGVVDFTPTTTFPDIRNRCAIHSTSGSCMVIPREGDRVRLYIQLADKDGEVVDPGTGRCDKSRIGPEKLLEVARRSMSPYTIETPDKFDWSTIYIIGQRVASKFSIHERLFIVGDACHTHSPKAGQGMNASMNDSHNLVWKITQVLRSWADISLLKTYEFERRKYAQDLIEFDKKFSALFSGKPRTEEYQDGISHEDFLRVFQTFGGFTSGIGIHYAPSALTDPSHQALAPNLIIGQRMLPAVLIRAADARAYNLHDLLPANTLWKILLFVGDVSREDGGRTVQGLAGAMGGEGGFLKRFAQGRFDIVTICKTKTDAIDYTSIPTLLRPHWSSVFTDDLDVTKRQGGTAYDTFGIDPKGGVIVVVRPDGYVGMVAPFEGVQEVDDYFEGLRKAA